MSIQFVGILNTEHWISGQEIVAEGDLSFLYLGIAPEGAAPRDLLPRMALARPPVPPRVEAAGHLRVPLQLEADGGVHQPLPLQAGRVARHAARPCAPTLGICSR
jgi:hypothetical protein